MKCQLPRTSEFHLRPHRRGRFRIAAGLCGSAVAVAVFAVSMGVLSGGRAAPAQTLPGERFQTIIENSVRAGVPGIALYVETWDGASWSGTAGVTAADDPQPLTPDLPFRLSGLSKLPVAALALMLVDDARLSLDDRIGKWVDPELIQNLPYAQQITIRDLIAETSGIRDYFDEDFIFMTRAKPDRKWRPEDLVLRAAEGEAFSTPDPKISHRSNTNYVLLGLAIEKAGGAPLAEQLAKRIFEPLGMTRTYSSETMPDPSPVHGHVLQFMARIDVSDIDLSMAWGAGNLISTAEDVAKMTRGLFEGNLLSRASRSLMTGNFRPLVDEDVEYGYGTTRFTAYDGPPVGQVGEGLGFATVAAWWPETGLVVVVLTNLEVEAHLGILETVANAVNAP